MKRIFATALIMAASWQWTSGQVFTYTAPITEKQGQHLVKTQFYSEITNLQAQADTFWIEMHTDVPAGWTVNFCTGSYCWAPWITLDSTLLLTAGGMDSILVDIYPDSTSSPLEGWVTMVVYPEGRFGEADSISFHCYLPGAAYVESARPAEFSLLRAYPNPFNNSVALQFSLAHPAWTNLKAYGVSGREVAEIYMGHLEGGEHRFIWEPGNAPSGLYFLRLEIAGSQQIEKLVYLR